MAVALPEADRIGSVVGRGEPKMEYFAGLDVSMAETHVCVVTRNGAVIHSAKGPSSSCRYCSRARAGSALPSDRIRDGPDGPNAVSRLEPTWLTRHLHRESAGLHGFEAVSDAQNRPQRCARPGALGSHRLLQARSCEIAVGTRCPIADHCPEEAGRPAGHSGKPDPRPCR